MVKITFPDGTVREYEQGVTGLQIAESISPALVRNVVSCGVNGGAQPSYQRGRYDSSLQV